MHLLTPPSSNYNHTRQSQFELIRILAQFFIVLYHIYRFFLEPSCGTPFSKAIWLPLHIGVILFILISGWFQIKVTTKSFLRLVTMMALLYFPLQIVWISMKGVGTAFEFATLPFFITWSPFWFMRTYIFLYLLSPIINYWMDHATSKRCLYTVAVFFFISIYAGTWSSDPSLLDGKNVINFCFIYILGRLLRKYQYIYQAYSLKLLATVWMAYNILIVSIFTIFPAKNGIDFIFTRLFFSYSSIGLIVNAILFFIILSKLKFKSRIINIMGGASLTIYMIHSSDLILYELIGRQVKSWLLPTFFATGNELMLCIATMLMTVAIIVGCVAIHYILLPIAKYIANQLTDIINTNLFRWKKCIPS